MKRILFYVIVLVTMMNCGEAKKDLAIKEKVKKDSLAIVKKKNDSISIRDISVSKKVEIGDKTITILGNAKTNDLIKFENEYLSSTTFYMQKRAERENTLLNIKFKLSSKSKSNTNNFFPDLNVFTIDKDKNSIKYIGTMDYLLVDKSNVSIAYLEQIFDFKESESFIGCLEIKKSNKDNVVISVNKGGNKTFNKDNIIASFLN